MGNAQVNPGDTAFKICKEFSSPSKTKSISNFFFFKFISWARIPGLPHFNLSESIPEANSEANWVKCFLEYFLNSLMANFLKLETVNKPNCLKIISDNSEKLKLSSHEYCSRQNAGIAVGPILIRPSTVIVKWVPKKGYCGSGTG